MDPVNNFFTVRRLANGIQRGDSGLRDVPETLLRLIETDAWKHYVTESGREYTHESFAAFVEAKPFEGIGATVKQLERLCVEHPKAREALQGVLKSKRGRGNKRNNNITDISTGTSQGYTLERLHRESPELYEQVCAGEMSANAAAIQAGFRKRMLSIPAEPAGAARAIRRHFTAGEIQELIDRLVE